MLPWMCGSATLAIVVSTPCMKVASMIETVIQPRFATAGAGSWASTYPPLGLSCAGEPREQPSTRSSHGRRYPVSTSTVALNPAWSGDFRVELSMLKRTGRR